MRERQASKINTIKDDALSTLLKEQPECALAARRLPLAAHRPPPTDRQEMAAAAASTYFVTGATDGIGLHTARRLAATAPPGSAVILHGRDPARLARAAELVDAARSGGSAADADAVAIRLAPVCDLASAGREGLRALAKGVVSSSSAGGAPLTVVHNAGVYAPRREMAAFGGGVGGGGSGEFERTWATNVLAPFALQHALLLELGWRRADGSFSSAAAAPPVLLAPPPPSAPPPPPPPVLARVVVTSSLSAQHGPLDFGNLQGERGYSGHAAYSLSKACNQAFAARLAEVLGGGGGGGGDGGGGGATTTKHPPPPTVFSLDPGTVDTKMLRSGWQGFQGIRVETADDTWWLATAPTPGGAESGAYFVGRRVARKVEAAPDRATVDRLWALWREQTGCDDLF